MVDPTARLSVDLDDAHVTIVGDVDASTCPSLASSLDPLPGTSGDIRLDVSGVGFIDSSGLRIIIGVHQRAAELGRKVLIEYPSASFQRILDVSGLTGMLHVIHPR